MRVARAIVAVGYCLAFVVVCLGACLSGTNEHACCEKGQGFTLQEVSSADCCEVTSGVSSQVAMSAPVAVASPTWLSQTVGSAHVTPFRRAAVQIAPSPPLILRV